MTTKPQGGNGGEEPARPELTPEQKARGEQLKASVDRFVKDLSFYIVRQMSIVKDGEISLMAFVKDNEIIGAEFSSTVHRPYNKDKEDA